MLSNVEMIKQLRNETGAGIMECRKALEQSDQNWESALAYLNEQARAKAEQQAKREAKQGRIELYSHGNGRIGVMVEINTETDFASRSEAFLRFAREVALHITAAAPLYVSEGDVPAEVLAELKSETEEQARAAGKPERVIEKIVQGVLDKYLEKNVLLRQRYIRDEEVTIGQRLAQVVGQTGENVVIRRFVRWEIVPDTGNE